MPENDNEDLKARMREALERKNRGGETSAHESGHHKEKGPAERSPHAQGGMFRRKAGGN